MQQLILNLDDPTLETALNSIAQKEGNEMIDVETQCLASQLILMACDPQIQRELRNIENEFSITESDSLRGY